MSSLEHQEGAAFARARTIGRASTHRHAAWLGAMAVGLLALLQAGPRPALPAAALGKQAAPAPITPADRERALESYGKLPLAFVPNRGQADARVRFSAQAGGASFWFTHTEASLSFVKEKRGVNLQLRFLGANPDVAVEGTRLGPGRVNYLLGDDPAKWRTNLPTYGEVVYRDLWPGIDLAFRGERGTLKYEFRLAPGARASDIRLAYRGTDRLSLDRAGGLRIHTGLGVLRDSRPVSYQVVAGRRVPVASRFALHQGGNAHGFSVGDYDRRQPLVIDPGLVYSTYLGGSTSDNGFAVTVDGAGSAYVTGVTLSDDFPTTPGAFDTVRNAQDAFVTKLNAAGTGLLYSTFLGGSSGFEWGQGIAVDGAGNAFVTGQTGSTDFPTTPGAFDTARDGLRDAFVTRLNAAGTALLYSTYLGGSNEEEGQGIAIDGTGSAYVTGETGSTDFPTTPGAFDTAKSGGFDVFVTKLDAAGTGLLYSTYLGGAGNDEGRGIAVDLGGGAYVTGRAAFMNFPTTPGAFDTTFNGGVSDAFVTNLNAAGTGLLYSTFLGGSDFDYGAGIAVDVAGSAYVTGETRSADFSTTPSSFDTTLSGFSDSFVTKLDAAGTALLYSTYLGGSSSDPGAGIAVDATGNAYVTGFTTSADFPTTLGAFDRTHNGGSDAFVTKLDAAGGGLLYSTYLGGSGPDGGEGIALDGVGSAYVTGDTTSANFPITPGAFDGTLNGTDVFVTKLDVIATVPAVLTLSPPAATNPTGTSHTVTATVTDAAGQPAPNVEVRFTVTGAVNTSGECTTGLNGQCMFTYQGPAVPGTDVITAYADSDNDGVQDAGEPTGAASKTWVAGTPATLVLDPPTATNPVGTSHTVTATVTDAGGNPVPDVVVRFTVTGSVNTSGECTTDANGQCDFTYQGPDFPGEDAITAFADTDGDNTQDAGEPAGAATKTWVLPVSTPGCEVKIADNGKITAANGDKASFHGHAQVSSAGTVVSGEQRYEDRGPVQPLTMQSINVLAVVCSPDRTEATLFGEATIDGSGRFDYRIRVKDGGEPGKGVDMYGILLSNGYFSGDKTLEAGNVQITVQA